MKVLIVNTLYYPYKVGGAELSVQSLAEEFSLLGINVGVLTLGEADDFYELNNVSVWSLKIENIFWPFNSKEKGGFSKLIWHIKDIENRKYDKKIKTVFESFNPDILFTNNLSGFSTRIWQLAQDFQIKVVHTIRDYYLQCPKTTKFKNGCNCASLCLDCKILSHIKKRNSNKIDYVIGISNFTLQNHLKEGYFKNVKSEVIYNGFSFNFELKKLKFLKSNKITFGYIGQINKEKGVELMLESFKKLEHIDKWNLIIAGNVSKEYLNTLKSINDSNKIKYLGYTDSKIFFDKIDVLIVPSLWNEPFGRVVLEGILNNKIVLTSNTGGIREIMENNQNFTFDPNSKDLSNLINMIITNREQIPFKSSSEFISRFNIRNTVSRYYKIFSKL